MPTELDVYAKKIGVTTRIDHSRCHVNTCRTVQVCPNCNKETFVAAGLGRWDQSLNDGRGATARPFDLCAIRLSCGCEFGDIEAARPRNSRDDTQNGDKA